MKKWISRFVSISSILAVVSLLLGYLAQYVDPRDIPFIALFALGLPLSLAFCFLLLLYYSIRNKVKWIYGIGLVLLLGLPTILKTFQASHAGEPSSDSIRVMSYNVRLFGYYQWRENNAIRNRIFNRLTIEKPFSELIPDN